MSSRTIIPQHPTRPPMEPRPRINTISQSLQCARLRRCTTRRRPLPRAFHIVRLDIRFRIRLLSRFFRNNSRSTSRRVLHDLLARRRSLRERFADGSRRPPLTARIRDRLFANIHLRFLLRGQSRPLVPRTNIPTRPHSPKRTIPKRKERLAEIGLDAPALVMHIMITSVIRGQMLERVPWESVAAVIVDGFESAAGEEADGLAG